MDLYFHANPGPGLLRTVTSIDEQTMEGEPVQIHPQTISSIADDYTKLLEFSIGGEATNSYDTEFLPRLERITARLAGALLGGTFADQVGLHLPRTNAVRLLITRNLYCLPFEVLPLGDQQSPHAPYLALHKPVGVRLTQPRLPPRTFPDRSQARAVVLRGYGRPDTNEDALFKQEADEVKREIQGLGLRCRDVYDPNGDRILESLQGTTLFHYVGHTLNNGDPKKSGLLLGFKNGEPAILSCSQLQELASANCLAKFLVLNTCNDAHGSGTIFQALAPELLARGIRSMIVTMTRIGISPPIGFAASFYRKLAKDTVGQALLEAKREAHAKRDPSWVYYRLLGDPSARILLPDKMNPPPPVAPAAAALELGPDEGAHARKVVLVPLGSKPDEKAITELTEFLTQVRNLGITGLVRLTEFNVTQTEPGQWVLELCYDALPPGTVPLAQVFDPVPGDRAPRQMVPDELPAPVRAALEEPMELFTDLVRLVLKLHEKTVVHALLCPTTVLLDPSGRLLIQDVGLYYARVLAARMRGGDEEAKKECRQVVKDLQPGCYFSNLLFETPLSRSTDADIHSLGMLFFLITNQTDPTLALPDIFQRGSFQEALEAGALSPEFQQHRAILERAVRSPGEKVSKAATPEEAPSFRRVDEILGELGIQQFKDEVQNLVQAGYPVLRFDAIDVGLVEAIAAHVAGKLGRRLLRIDLLEGLREIPTPGESLSAESLTLQRLEEIVPLLRADFSSFFHALEAVSRERGVIALVVAADELLAGSLANQRALRDFLDRAARDLQGRVTVLLLAESWRDVILDNQLVATPWQPLPPPDPGAIERTLVRELANRQTILNAVESHTREAGLRLSGTEQARLVNEAVEALLGLTHAEVLITLRKRLSIHGGCLGRELILGLQEERLQRVRDMSYICPLDVHSLGKEQYAGWESLHPHLRVPWFRFQIERGHLRGLLVQGASGVGKTHFLKCLAGEHRLPMLRLSFDAIYSSAPGQSEWRLERALATTAQMSPCLVVADGLDHRGGSGAVENIRLRLLSTLLFWMAEHPGGVLLAVECREAADLPPELIRTGRIDLHIKIAPLDSFAERQKILQTSLSRWFEREELVSHQLDINWWARETEGLLPAEIDALAAELALSYQRRSSFVADSEILYEYRRRSGLKPRRADTVP